jgi:hypothetical protein
MQQCRRFCPIIGTDEGWLSMEASGCDLAGKNKNFPQRWNGKILTKYVIHG